MALFPEAWMDELLAKNDIVSIASEYVSLKPKGRRMWGCCPFHNEKTASFSVTPDNQLYYCFGCHAGGGVVQFVMEIEKLSYIEAIKHLAQRVGMELPGEVNDAKLIKERALKERLYAACKEAARYYHAQLMGEQGAGARRYLAGRGLDGATVKRFGLGYAPPGWDNLLNHLLGCGFSRRELVMGGLAIEGKKKDSCYDAYRGRIIFPIIATTGRVIGFGARAMGDEQPKYINTGDTPVYNKRSNLYALNMQRGKHPQDLVMVEGYMDVISLHKHGVDNAVASLGTALTQQQARLIKRYVNRVYICYDGDAAGQSATLRGLDILAREGLDVKVILIPGGMDPDDYIKQEGKDAYLTLKDKAISLTAFKLEYLAAGLNMDSEDGREEFAKKACRMVGAMEPVERERYAPQIARMAGIPIQTIKAQFGMAPLQQGNSIAKNRNTRSKKSEQAAGLREKTEQLLLSCMMCGREAALAAASGMAEEGLEFASGARAALAERLVAAHLEGGEADIKRFIAHLEPELAEEASAASGRAEAMVNPVGCAKDCIKTLKRELAKEQMLLLAQRAADAGGEERGRLNAELGQLGSKLKEL